MKIKTILLIVAGVVMLGGLGGASFYYYTRYQHTQELLRNPAAAAQEEIKNLVSRVGTHIVLPQGENPTIATVSDKSKLAEQPFFAKAEVGDKVLLYPLAARAILYRPALDKIIEIGSPSAPSVAGTATSSAQLQAARLAIYNSTSTVGLASVAEQEVKKLLNKVVTVAKQNSNSPFAITQVIILVPEATTLGNKLGEIFKAEIKNKMPEGEIKPESDLLLIVGQDFAVQTSDNGSQGNNQN